MARTSTSTALSTQAYAATTIGQALTCARSAQLAVTFWVAEARVFRLAEARVFRLAAAKVFRLAEARILRLAEARVFRLAEVLTGKLVLPQRTLMSGLPET